MAVEVALAMLHRDGQGCWGLFGGHGDPGETPEQALQRELLEEISWQPPAMDLVIVDNIHHSTAHVFLSELSIPLEKFAAAGRSGLGPGQR